MTLFRALLISLLFVCGAAAQQPITASGQAFEWGLTQPSSAAAITELTNATHISYNSDWGLALRSDGSLLAWGSNNYSQTNAPAGTDWVHCHAGWTHGIAVDSSGNVDEWGEPYWGDIDDWEALRPAGVTNETIVMVAAGDDHSAALDDNGVVYLWGGRATVTNYNETITNATMIACGWYHLLALLDDGTVEVIGTESQPTQDLTVPAGLTSVTNINCSQFSNYAIEDDGTLTIWGMTNYGLDVVPANGTNVVSAGGGRYHSVLARDDGVVIAWGDNGQGQTSVPATLTNSAFVTGGRYISQAIQASGGDPDPQTNTTFYVATDGSDSNTGGVDDPFLTIQKGVDTATDPGDTVVIAPGDYDEYVTSKASGSDGDPITILGNGTGVILKAFRVNNHEYITLDSLEFTKAQNLWFSHVRVEASAHNLTVKNCFIHSTPFLVRDDWLFDNTTNSISSPSGSDWAAAGFEVGGYIYCGGSGLTNLVYANHDTTYTISAITNDVLYVSSLDETETNNAAWAPIFSGNDGAEGINGISFIIAGGAAATNAYLYNNTFSNIYGSPFVLKGSDHLVDGNWTYNSFARASIHPFASDSVIQNNVWLNATNWIYYGPDEDVPHEAGPEWWDFVQGHIHTTTPGTNVTFYKNWWENIHQPVGDIDESGGGTNWLFSSNVFVGVLRNMGIGVNGTTFRNNTFYRISHEENQSFVMAQMGNATNTPATNMVNIYNAYIDIGPHASTNAEGFYRYDYTNYVVDSYFGSNWVAGPEVTGWQGKGIFDEDDGINGGDPMFFEPSNPRGDDGLPFTADDGLKPMPQGQFALLSIGALTPMSVTADTPLVYFTVQPETPGWYDGIGTNYDAAWFALDPYDRTNTVRPWTTADALGNVPCTVTLDASSTISGDFSTTNRWGIVQYWVDWGDGAVNTTWTPTNTHTYLWPGEFTITAWAKNQTGNFGTNSRTYRVLDVDDYSGTIYHVATDGDNANPGTYAEPFLTISNALEEVVDGDYIAVQAGTYDEYLDVDRDVASSSRISVIGYGAKIGGAKIRYSNWTFSGFEADESTEEGLGAFYIFQAADDVWLENLFIHDTATNNDNSGAIHIPITGDKNPLNGSLNGRIINCTFSNITEQVWNMHTGSNWLFSGFLVFNTMGEGDFIRPRGANNTIQDGYIYGLDNGDSGGHPDFIQMDQPVVPDGKWMKDILIQRVWLEGNTESDSDAAIAQFETLNFASDHYTNIIIRNCIFENVRGALSDSIDGLKLHNNLFYRSPRESGHVTTGGGAMGSSYGTEFYNNLFVGVNLTDANNLGWYYNDTAGDQATNTTVIANYNFVTGTNYTAKQVAPPDDLYHWAVTGTEANGVNGGNPQFVSEFTSDFRLLTNSPAYGVGVDLSSQFTTDFMGETITTWSMGPLQTSGEGTPAPVNSATAISATVGSIVAP